LFISVGYIYTPQPIASQQGPGDARVLVGQCHGGDIDVAPPDQLVQPGAAIGVLACPVDDRPCTMDQQRPQVRVAALAHAQQHALAAT